MGLKSFMQDYIAPRTYAFALFSEERAAPVIRFGHEVIDIEDMHPVDIAAVCRGLYPILMIRLGYVFKRAVPANEIEAFLLRDLNGTKCSVHYTTAFVSAGIREQFLESLRRHCARGPVVRKTGPKGKLAFCGCRQDESLTYLWVGLEPIPGNRAVG